MSGTCVVSYFGWLALSDIHSSFGFMQKDGVRPGEPDYDPRTLLVPKSAWKEFTPFEKQVWRLISPPLDHG